MPLTLKSERSWESLTNAVTKAEPSSGIAYLRARHDNKAITRNQAARWLSRKQFPERIRILSMPSTNWSFERMMLQNREGDGFPMHGNPELVSIVCIEREEEIWRAAIKSMPGMRSSLSILNPPSFATGTVATNSISSFHRCTFEAMSEQEPEPFDAAWLDFTGTVTIKRLGYLQQFWNRLIDKRLILTCCHARWTAETSKSIESYGSFAAWINDSLPNSVLREEIRYKDSVPMIQLVLDKV